MTALLNLLQRLLKANFKKEIDKQMDINKHLVIVKGEDKTNNIISWRNHPYKNLVLIKFNGGKEYPYNKYDVRFFENPKSVDLKEKMLLKGNCPLVKVAQLLDFGSYYRVVYQSGYTEVCRKHEIRILTSALRSPISKNTFEYLRQIAIQTGLNVGGSNILATRYDKMDFVREDSVMAPFLSGSYHSNKSSAGDSIIYPFGFNLSQKQAVDNALNNQISIIEGPPGTGKTQTILNIIANAVMRGESVAVVSSNNSATANVYEKLEKYGIDFIAAPLGNADNKDAFISAQTPKLPDMNGWKLGFDAFIELKKAELELNAKLKLKNELSKIMAEEDALTKEFEHFKDYFNTLKFDKDMPEFYSKTVAKKILRFIAEYEIVAEKQAKISFSQKVVWTFKYGLKKFKFYGKSIDVIAPYCQNIYYHRRLSEIKKRVIEIKAELDAFDFDVKMKTYTALSMKAFKSNLAKKYSGIGGRRIYGLDDLWKNSEEFIKDYPVVLSTTYSLRASLSSRFVYDYVIVDEASQVDLATGALALSCAKKAVIVGDLKQLPNVVNSETKKITDEIFEKYGLKNAYKYSENSLLSSMIRLFPDAPHVLLKEHYRCHPEIIGFCNQRFYNNELIVLTQPKSSKQPLIVYRTAAGNHARNHVNQRQIEVITDEVFPNQNLNKEDGSVGIVTPYRNQANELQKVFNGTSVKADTADKFQGQERSVMIFSTVDNEITEFASDPNRLNVAVSRAIDQFIVVTDGNDNDATSPIHELIGYIQYHNHEIVDSNIHSVFDNLYRDYAEAREEIMRKYGRVSDVDSENLMYRVIRDLLSEDSYNKYDVVTHVPLRMILSDLAKLETRELAFATNHLTHVDFLIYSKLTHQPILVVEVDGFAYHNNPKQQERDQVKNTILYKYNIPILRLSTIGSGEKEKLVFALDKINS